MVPNMQSETNLNNPESSLGDGRRTLTTAMASNANPTSQG
jgi:hypothetical protein